MSGGRAFVGASVVAGLGLLAAAPGVRGALGEVPYPEGYRGWAHVKSMVIQPGHPLFDSFGGIHHVYANEAARAVLEARGSAYPDGAVLVFDLLEAPVEGGAVTEGARKVLAVMHKDRARFVTIARSSSGPSPRPTCGWTAPSTPRPEPRLALRVGRIPAGAPRDAQEAG